MTITHHPDEAMLAAYAAGSLDLGQHVAIATHLALRECRAWARVDGAGRRRAARRRVAGGACRTAPSSGRGAARRAGARRSAAAAACPPTTCRRNFRVSSGATHSAPGAGWRRASACVPIRLPEPSPTRVFLLRSAPGARLVQHEHTGLEMTCVLSGAFAPRGRALRAGRFRPRRSDDRPRAAVEAGVDCVCLVAMQGDLRLSGLIGRLMQPFVRL